MAKEGKPNSKPILRSDRQAKRQERNSKLNVHINQGVDDYVRGHYNDRKEARKNARWYQTGEALKEAEQQAMFDADREFLEEFTGWAEKQQEEFYAQLDAEEQEMLEVEDDVIDVPFKELAPRRKRQSLLGSSVPSLGSSNRAQLPSEISNQEGRRKLPSRDNNDLPEDFS